MNFQILLTIATLTTTLSQEIYRKEWTSFYPCKGSKDITISFENIQPRDESFYFFITVRGTFPEGSIIYIKFLSPEYEKWTYPNLEFRLSNGAILKARLYAKEKNPIFRIRSSHGISMHVKSVVIDDVEYCKNPDSDIVKTIQTNGGNITHSFNETIQDDSLCGKRQTTSNQVDSLNNTSTNPGDWPWHVAIRSVTEGSLKYLGGGTLISKSSVLTAAHCVTEKGVPLSSESLSVVIGKHDFGLFDDDSEQRKVRQVVLHPDFSYVNLGSDIAVLRLGAEVEYNEFIQPACLWRESDYEIISTEFTGMVAGWSFAQRYTPTSVLRQAYLSRVMQSKCGQSESDTFFAILSDQNFCVEATQGGTPCIGDSGSGLMVLVPNDENGSWHVRGILAATSKADNKKCDGSKPAIFTDVALFTPWLREFLQ